ncbi:MAG: endonuclease/exonuclease/phosphatase family protein [Alphaproteobacteria bacterium]
MPGIVGILWIGIVGGALVVAAGEFGRTTPWLDTLNHFRPQLAIIVGTLAVAALPVRRWLLAVVGAAAAGWATLAVLDDGACTAPPGGPPLRLITFNLWAGNYDTEAVAERVRAFDADVVLFQEYGQVQLPLRQLLADAYPHQIDCANDRGCRLALFAKEPWVTAATTGRSDGVPPILSARFAATGDRPAFTVVGTHLARPTDGWDWQASDLADLTAHVRGLEGPLVLAGDFNATPWSFALEGFRAATGLCGAPGYRPSWPDWLDAVGVPIDHVFVSEGLGISAEVLLPAGSDHLPIGAVIALP